MSLVLIRISMRCLRIKFPLEELDLLKEATKKFNDHTAYLDDVKLRQHKEYQILFVPIPESSLFVGGFIKDFPRFSKERIRRDLIKMLSDFLEYEDPGNIAAERSLEELKELIF